MNTLDLIKKAVGQALGDAKLYRSATLLKQSPGTRIPGQETSGTNATYTSYPCRGLIELLTIDDVPTGTLVEKDDRKIGIIGSSLPPGVVPGSIDKVTIQDVDGVSKTFRLVQAITGDGAGAFFEFTARK